MKILALALTDQPRRLLSGYPPRGARLLLRPEVEVLRLASLLDPPDVLIYLDERVNRLEWQVQPDLVLIRVALNSEDSARDLHRRLAGSGLTCVHFGPAISALGRTAPDWAPYRIIGSITSAWPELRADASSGRVRNLYVASRTPDYVPAQPGLTSGPDMYDRYQPVNFIRGCACPERYADLCSEYLYHGTNRIRRQPAAVIGEVVSLPGKHITLLDEDVALFPEYYTEVFRRLWSYRRHWTVRASARLFDHPVLIDTLAKAGTKLVILDETFVDDWLGPALSDRRLVRSLYRRVKQLQSHRMLVGARLTLDAGCRVVAGYGRIAGLLSSIDLDLIETRFYRTLSDGRRQLLVPEYRPRLDASDPAWLRSQFYSMKAIVGRLARRPRRVGFHSTLVYLLPHSLAYRQNFFEGIPDY